MNKLFETEIQELLLDIGIPTHLLGFYYITYGIQLALKNPDYVMKNAKMMYIEIAQHYNTSASAVERCIRNAISIGWAAGSTDCVAMLFKNSINSKRGIPTNNQFIARVYLYIKTMQ